VPRSFYLNTLSGTVSGGGIGALASVAVDVFRRGTTSIATIFTTENLGTVASNPFVTTSSGTVAFWAEPGAYDIRLTDTLGPPRFSTYTIGWDSVPFGAESIPVGSVSATIRQQVPSGWLFCNGTAVSRTTYAPLWDVLRSDSVGVLGTTSPYGNGDGTTTFNLPDLRGRVPVGVDGAAGLLSALDLIGNLGGAESHSLTIAELAAHNHNITTSNNPLDSHQHFASSTPSGSTSAASSFLANPSAVAAVGSGTAHNNMQPYLILNWMVKT